MKPVKQGSSATFGECMTEIVKYGLAVNGYGHGDIVPHPRGTFVSIKDFEKLQSEIKRLETEVKYWQDKEVEKAPCCLNNELQNIKLREQLRIATDALEFLKNDLDLIAVTPTEISHLEKCKNTLAEIEGMK